MNDLRQSLIDIALAWEQAFGNAPSITSALSELDAALLVGCGFEEYSAAPRVRIVVASLESETWGR